MLKLKASNVMRNKLGLLELKSMAQIKKNGVPFSLYYSKFLDQRGL